MNIYEYHLQHLIRMASIPGFKAYAWERAKELARDELWRGIDERLKQEMLRRIDERKK